MNASRVLSRALFLHWLIESVSPEVKTPNTLWVLFPSLKKMWGSHLPWPPAPLPTSLLPLSSHVSSTAALTSPSIWGSLTESQTSLHNSVCPAAPAAALASYAPLGWAPCSCLSTLTAALCQGREWRTVGKGLAWRVLKSLLPGFLTPSEILS